ncbi:MAG: rRNA pseudouridine synthase [Calditrichaeota bacterium]|nr:rRNA pseudouridine synthase [Calditrichota bacterium]
MRLSRFLALAGAASRRSAEDLICAGRVRVGGKVVLDPATGVEETSDITLDGAPLEIARARTYIIYHKPAGVITTLAKSREPGLSLPEALPDLPERLFPVGRLDRETTGLLILTDDGDLAFRLIHPRHEVEKEYLVRLNRPLGSRDFERIRKGIIIDERKVEVSALLPAPGGRCRVVIHEGRKHIVRRLFRELKLTVVELKRTRIGPVALGRLGVGRWRKLTPGEVQRLKQTAGL